MGFAAGEPTCAAEPMSGLEMALSKLETEVSEAELAAENLTDRLQSVLMPDSQIEKPGPDVKGPDISSKAVNRVVASRERLNAVLVQLHRLMQRLDV